MIRNLLKRERHLTKIAVIEKDREIQYVDLLEKTRALGSLLPKKQANIAIFLPNGGDYIAAFWGTVMAGLTAFPINVLLTKHEALPLLKKASVDTVITSSAYQKYFEEITLPKPHSLKLIFIDELDKAKFNTAEQKLAALKASPNAPMMLLSTSGTTANSKIVQLSEKNIETAVLGYLEKLKFNKMDLSAIRYVLSAPFSSVYGMMIISACLYMSFPIIVLDNTFTLDMLYMAADKHKATHYEGSASAIFLMNQTVGRTIPYDIGTLKYFGFGGSKISGSIVENVQKEYPNMGFYQGYGMTEASPLIAKHPQIKLKKADSVGTAIKGVEIAIEAMGKITNAPHTTGEILVKGPNIMLGYYKNEEETHQVLKNGYLYTGDIGYLDADGYLFICGRKKNVVIIRGFNVFPEEVESCLIDSLLARDCVVYGTTNDFGIELLCADVVPANPSVNEEHIRAYCNAHLAKYKIPQKITLSKSIQKNAGGKSTRYL